MGNLLRRSARSESLTRQPNQKAAEEPAPLMRTFHYRSVARSIVTPTTNNSINLFAIEKTVRDSANKTILPQGDYSIPYKAKGDFTNPFYTVREPKGCPGFNTRIDE